MAERAAATGAIPTAFATRIAAAELVLVVTGSGISAESGVPTFRDAQSGLWARYRPEDLATPEAFVRDPDLVWQWYAWRRQLVAQASPNPAHLALAELASLVPRLVLVTQNVDGLHQRAGSRGVIEYHGNIARSLCFECGREQAPDPAAGCPRCRHCNGLLRPGVVWFGEPIPPLVRDAAQQAAQTCDVLLSAGTSALVYPAAALAATAREHGARIAEFNLEPTPQSHAMHYVVSGPAGRTLPALIAALRDLTR